MSTDAVTETNTGGTAIVNATSSFDLSTSTNVNQLALTGTGTGLTATGNASNDIITDSTTGIGGNILTDGNNLGHDTMIDTAGNLIPSL